MNKYQEALNDVINNNLGNWKYKNDSFYFLQELVDKQTPKKAYWNHTYYCDVCNMEVKKYDNYCPNCGQRLEWEE